MRVSIGLYPRTWRKHADNWQMACRAGLLLIKVTHVCQAQLSRSVVQCVTHTMYGTVFVTMLPFCKLRLRIEPSKITGEN